MINTNNQHGYNLIVLVVLIAIVVIVAVKVIPTYSMYKSDTEQPTTQKMVK